MPYKDKEQRNKYIAEWMAIWRLNPINRNIEKERNKKYRLNNLEVVKQTQQRTWRKLKLDVFNAYSGGNPRCMCPGCPIKYLDFLELDHVIPVGVKTRIPTSRFYTLLRQNNYPNKDNLQILCCNCNKSKRNNKKCSLYGKDHVTGI